MFYSGKAKSNRLIRQIKNQSQLNLINQRLNTHNKFRSNIWPKRAFAIFTNSAGPHLIQSLAPEHKNLDFCINLGHNDYYKDLVGTKLSLWNRLKFTLYSRSYKTMFRNKYKSLLKSIEEMKYYQLEQALEPQLLKALAADIYQLVKVENWEFEIINPEAPVNVSILNYSKLKVPTLSDDEQATEYQLQQVRNGIWRFVHFNESDGDLQEWELRLKAK